MAAVGEKVSGGLLTIVIVMMLRMHTARIEFMCRSRLSLFKFS